MKIIHIWDHLYSKRFVFLTIFLLLFLILPPFLDLLQAPGIIIIILYTLILAFCLVIITGHDRPGPLHLLLIILLVIPFIQVNESSFIGLSMPLILAGIYGWAALKIVSQLLKIKAVTPETIMGAVGGYLLIGLAGSFINFFVSSIDPEAFNIPFVYNSVYNFVYFTFVTLTTLGYGDFTPQTPQAQSISMLIALTGQIYLTILIAILVGKYINTFGNN